jgi:subtilisin family serine protease
VWPAKKIQLEALIDALSFTGGLSGENYSVHDITGVDKLHEAGIFGKGALVAVVDTGIYYEHPDVRACKQVDVYRAVTDDGRSAGVLGLVTR